MVTSGKLIQQQRSTPRITYCLLTPNSFERNRVTVLVDSMANRGPANFRRVREVAAGKKEEPGSEGAAGLPTLVDMSKLNQSVFKSNPDDYG